MTDDRSPAWKRSDYESGVLRPPPDTAPKSSQRVYRKEASENRVCREESIVIATDEDLSLAAARLDELAEEISDIARAVRSREPSSGEVSAAVHRLLEQLQSA
jgi:hypothetical protein